MYFGKIHFQTEQTPDCSTSAFVDVVDRANKLSSVQTSGAAETENKQDDYGYGGDGSNPQAAKQVVIRFCCTTAQNILLVSVTQRIHLQRSSESA